MTPRTWWELIANSARHSGSGASAGFGQVPAAVAAALGIRELPGVPAAEALARVLVPDNCEHVIGATAQLCAGLLPACDDLRMLATSREPLAVAG